MFTFEPVYSSDSVLTDIVAQQGTRRIYLLGSAGKKREESIVEPFFAKEKNTCLPVLLGSGMGYALTLIALGYSGSFALVEKNTDILRLTKILETLPNDIYKRIFVCIGDSPKEIVRNLTKWQQKHGNKQLFPIINPFYQRIDPDFYAQIRKILEASTQFDFWSKVKMPRFACAKPRILLLTSKYFLMGELISACKTLGLETKLITIANDEIGQEEFVEQILKAVLTFKPDCCITLNHMGIDREGVLMDLLARLELPLASWFVDNPHLIIHLYTKCISPWTALFTFDEDTVSSLKQFGFPNVFYLPLGTDPIRFSPSCGKPRPEWPSRISFVGNSMLYKVGARLKKSTLPKTLTVQLQEIAKNYVASEQRSVRKFLEVAYPETFKQVQNLPTNEDQLAFETALTWQATRVYRKSCVTKLLPFYPTIAGDSGWRIEFAKEKYKPRYLPELSYYSDLPIFYTCQDISFNATSQQMKGAVNQRIFDCPCAGGFVITDWRKQMDALFTPEEMVCYRDIDEIPELVSFFLRNSKSRKTFAKRARKRVLACHTWEKRLEKLLEQMRTLFATPRVHV